MRNGDGKPPFSRVCLRASVWIVLIAIITLVASKHGLLHGLEMAGLDTFVRQQPASLTDRLFIIEITDADYANRFQSNSPLDPHDHRMGKRGSSWRTRRRMEGIAC